MMSLYMKVDGTNRLKKKKKRQAAAMAKLELNMLFACLATTSNGMCLSILYSVSSKQTPERNRYTGSLWCPELHMNVSVWALY